MESRAAVEIDLVSLYKALGGGWENNDPVAMVPNGSGKQPAKTVAHPAPQTGDEATGSRVYQGSTGAAGSKSQD